MQLAYVMRLAKQYMALGAIGMFAAILVMVLSLGLLLPYMMALLTALF